VAQFTRDNFLNCDAPRAVGPKTAKIPEIINQIHEVNLEDGRTSSKSIAEQLGVSSERVASIVNENFDTRKLSAKWVQKLLNADQNRQRCQ
jgi:hypothetical protein